MLTGTLRFNRKAWLLSGRFCCSSIHLTLDISTFLAPPAAGGNYSQAVTRTVLGTCFHLSGSSTQSPRVYDFARDHHACWCHGLPISPSWPCRARAKPHIQPLFQQATLSVWSTSCPIQQHSPIPPHAAWWPQHLSPEWHSAWVPLLITPTGAKRELQMSKISRNISWSWPFLIDSTSHHLYLLVLWLGPSLCLRGILRRIC